LGCRHFLEILRPELFIPLSKKICSPWHYWQKIAKSILLIQPTKGINKLKIE
jgi:hypothetical protein